jgi:hypothetical protein
MAGPSPAMTIQLGTKRIETGEDAEARVVEVLMRSPNDIRGS